MATQNVMMYTKFDANALTCGECTKNRAGGNQVHLVAQKHQLELRFERSGCRKQASRVNFVTTGVLLHARGIRICP
jgi:hypothetical protein